MSFQEKSTWITASAQVVVATWCASRVLPQIGTVPVGDIAYLDPLLVMIGASVALTVLATVLVAGTLAARAAIRQEATDVDRTDERDRSISRWAGNIGGIVLGVGVVPAFGLTVFEFEHFWIAQALLAALLASELVSAALLIHRYRRGF
jgi:hypothetical protein